MPLTSPTRPSPLHRPPSPARACRSKHVRTFSAIYNLVKQAYVEDVGDKELMEAAIKGLLSGLDPHSEYLDARQWTELTEDTSGAYDGLGLEVLTVDGVLRVIAPIDDTPAERGGIKAGRRHHADRRQGRSRPTTSTRRSTCCAAIPAAASR